MINGLGDDGRLFSLADLLEKWRVTKLSWSSPGSSSSSSSNPGGKSSLATSERNFHLFYLLLSGAEASLISKWGGFSLVVSLNWWGRDENFVSQNP